MACVLEAEEKSVVGWIVAKEDIKVGVYLEANACICPSIIRTISHSDNDRGLKM